MNASLEIYCALINMSLQSGLKELYPLNKCCRPFSQDVNKLLNIYMINYPKQPW